ncbi:MAG: hypothetical protein H6709_24360, partial [Kofleriaceae bacterium]|nr:hypothetical protein [Kofleriaceae bacterium]
MTTASTGVAVIAALTLGLAGCGDNAVDDAFAWRVDLTDLDPALLAAAVTDREIVVVGGGPGGAVLLSWDDATRTWRRPALPGGADTLWWTWIGADDAAIAVGARATVLRRVGGAWQADDVHDLVGGEVTLYGAWGAGADDVWVVGGTLAPSPTPGVVLHFDGAGWQLAAVVDHALYKVWGAAADDLWAVGEAGTILHGDGATWTATTSPTTSRLIAVIGRAGDEVYAVGGDDGGVVLRWDGATWARFATTPARLSGVWTAPGAALFVAGADGYLERFGADDAAPPSA